MALGCFFAISHPVLHHGTPAHSAHLTQCNIPDRRDLLKVLTVNKQSLSIPIQTVSSRLATLLPSHLPFSPSTRLALPADHEEIPLQTVRGLAEPSPEEETDNEAADHWNWGSGRKPRLGDKMKFGQVEQSHLACSMLTCTERC